MTNYITDQPRFRTRLSFMPLLRAWETITREGKPGMQAVYRNLLQKVKQYPELLVPIENDEVLSRHQQLIEEMMTTVFPVTVSDQQDLFAVCVPFKYKTIYASQLFRNLFLGNNGNTVIMPDSGSEKELSEEKLLWAYQLVLARFYNVNVKGTVQSVHPYKSPLTQLDKHMELELDVRFVDISVNGPLPELPEGLNLENCSITEIAGMKELREKIKLDLFSFEGFIIVYVREVTEREVINKIKNRLLAINSFDDTVMYDEIQTEIQNLVGVPGIQIALKPFFRVNDLMVVTNPYTTNRSFLSDLPPSFKHLPFYDKMTEIFSKTRKPLIVLEINDEVVKEYEFFDHFRKKGWRNVIAFPLFDTSNKLLGMLGIFADKPGLLKNHHIEKLEPVIPLFVLAIEKSQEMLDSEVDKVIKDKFTAVQQAVEWRFTEAAFTYISKKQEGKEASIEPIIFNNVYPLYGSLDIRNSSVERNNATQQDMLEQLHMVDEIVRQAQLQTKFPLLDEIRYKLDKYSDLVASAPISDGEFVIQNFLKNDISALFRYLQSNLPSLNKAIADYFESINSPVEMLYSHRQEYENSITQINEEVASFIDKEQEAAQQIFPHYFERFVTDGVDFNMYVGQSISPERKFDSFYLKNLKMWQLAMMAKAGQVTKRLEKKLSKPLQTTQLILAHGHPISISFRISERKFDVDGSFNAYYEIVKKRIDKVHIKNSNERFTQPGMLAIVYSLPAEGEEYQEYLNFLVNTQLLKGPIQQFELEELQGVIGLKGLRIAINLDEENNTGEPTAPAKKAITK